MFGIGSGEFFKEEDVKLLGEKDKSYCSYGNRDLMGKIFRADAFPEPAGGTCYLESNTPEYAMNVFYRVFDKVVDYKILKSYLMKKVRSTDS